jgi:2-oxoglutarate dehydrogenase E1 component
VETVATGEARGDAFLCIGIYRRLWLFSRPSVASMNLPNHTNLAFVEALYDDFVRDPNSVPAEWRPYLAGMLAVDGPDIRPGRRPSFPPGNLFRPRGGAGEMEATVALQDRVDQLVRNYRVRGHIMAQMDPLQQDRPNAPELDPKFYGFTEADMDRRFSVDTMERQGTLTLREIIERLRNTYCRSIGVQYMHIDDLKMRRWLAEKMESSQNRIALSREAQRRILTRLTDATVFEEFIRRKYVGAKSFSLEGAETLIPLLDLAIEKSAESGIIEIVLGMAHRGRLNVLANIMGKSPREIFRLFEDKDPDLYKGRGDVKYHLGYGNDWVTSTGKKMHLSLCFNPSHLEFVNPVALGRMRAKMDRGRDLDRSRGMVVLIHGDAAFIGEGIVQETLNLSRLPAYATGGTLHIILNNQIGFTTGPEQGRSAMYATSVAKMLPAPILHVNGEDPEAVAQCVHLALEFRRAFKLDVVIDMYCYRRLGHNETDEPSFTQPLLYRTIEHRKPVREGYLDHLLALGGITQAEADAIAAARREALEKNLAEAKAEPTRQPGAPGGIWKGYLGGPESGVNDVDTGVSRKRLAELLAAQTRLPADFHLHPKLRKFIEGRQEMARGEKPLDWSAAEALAYASLLTDGVPVRMTGQDCQRGTFTHRHAVLHDVATGQTYTPLANLAPGQAELTICNSPLSETGVLGFEYGYSVDCPHGLTLWEAQFGDFVNVAQVIIDQFIVSAEDKWRRLSGLVMLLPHGFEGQGPEHSSARLERFLELGAEDNIQVIVPSTPAQIFHALRRQIVRAWRKPLIVMTPKSLLRHPQCVSPLDDLARGRFQRIIPDAQPPAGNVRRILLTSGKLYYELEQRRQDLGRTDVAILRVEQPYPLPLNQLQAALLPYPEHTPVMWVQEEPENMGAWRFLRVMLGEKLFGRPFWRIARATSASPATGSHNSHKREQEQLLQEAFEV